MEYKFKPILDKDTFTVSFGEANNIPLLRKYTTAKKEFDLLCKISGLWDRRLYGKEFYKQYTEKMGITPSATIKLLAKFSWKELLCGFEKKQVYRWCYWDSYRPTPNEEKFKSLKANKHHVEQALADNQENLVPFILRFNKSPKELKDSLSRSEWKTLVNNSLTRNKLLASKTEYKKLLGVSSGTLKYLNRQTTTESLICIDNYLKNSKCISSLSGDRRIYSLYTDIRTIEDTVHMAQELGEKYNKDWGYNRWQQEHDRLARIYETKDFEDVEIKLGMYPKLPRLLSDNGYTATLLTTPKRVAEEGALMGHCVASYAHRCRKGGYIVYSITSPEGVRSTLGLYGDGSVEQHKLKYNGRPNEATLDFGKFVSEKITKGE